MYLYLTWAGLMDKMFRTYFLLFFRKKAAIKCRRSKAVGTCYMCHTRAGWSTPTREKHPVSRARAGTSWASLHCCDGKALLSCKEKRAILLPLSLSFLLSLSREHWPLLWWNQGQRWRMVGPAGLAGNNPTVLQENVWKSPPDFYQLKGKGE